MSNPMRVSYLALQQFIYVQMISSKFDAIGLYSHKVLAQRIFISLNNKLEKMKSKFLLLSLLVLGSNKSFANQCWNAKGKNVVDSVHYNLSNTFSQGENAAGQTKNLKVSSLGYLEAKCDPRWGPSPINSTTRAYVTDQAIVATEGKYKYVQINEYLLGAMRINDSAIQDFYPPIRVNMGAHPNVDPGLAFPVNDTDLILRLKVIKPFVGNVSIPSKTMFTVYVTTTPSDPLSYPVYTISYSGRIVAPQSCTIDSGKVLDIKFGDILASEFNQAGAGNKPNSVNPETRSVSVQCSNMNAAATLTFRIESEKSQGDMIMSNNADVGFKISDMSNNILIPNNLLSFSQFKLDSSQHATISFKAWPVSVTGKKPTLGPFSSRAYIRIDFP